MKSTKRSKTMALKIDIPQPDLLKPKITIFGAGGAGGNAINNMIRANLEGVEFVAANTDAQSLQNSLAKHRIQLGLKTTKGLGAGSFPDRGKAAAEENIEEIEKYLEGSNMVFIAAGMGGGTGTGAAPVIAKLARERDILTVGVVTKPFHFEGKYRMETAETGIDELKKYVDTLIVIPNQNLFRIANENTTFESAFKMADDVLHAGVRGITDLITMPGLVNLDFADIRTIMTKMGKAMMGTGEATGENRAIAACEAAVSNPLLDDISIRGAKGVLVNMTGGPDMTLFEADMAVNAIKKEVDPNANIIFGSAFNENMKGKIRISVVATGIDEEEYKRDVFRSQENHEPSRFRINQGAASLENQSFTVKNQIEKEAIKTSNYSFFDPGVATKPENEDLEVVDANSDFKLKKSYFDEEKIIEKKSSEFEKPTFKTSDNIDKYEEKTNQKKSVSVSFFGNEIVNDDDSFEDSVEKQEVKKETKIAGESFSSEKTKLSKKEKKESQGFGLFSFMNSSKSKEEKISNEIEAKESVLQNFDSIETDKKTDELSQKADKKRREFFGSTIFDEENKDQNDKALDDDILNVPAFFRRKK